MSQRRLEPFLRTFHTGVKTGLQEVPKYIYANPDNPMIGYLATYSMPYQLGENWFFKRLLVHEKLGDIETTFGPYDNEEDAEFNLRHQMQLDDA